MVKINLGFNKKRYTRDMSYDNNTTFSFGDVSASLFSVSFARFRY